MQLPPLAAALNGADPSSPNARAAKKALKKAISKARDAAKQGQIFFKDLGGGPGDRLRTEVGFARRAAAARLTFSQSMMRSLADGAEKKLNEAGRFLGGGQNG